MKRAGFINRDGIKPIELFEEDDVMYASFDGVPVYLNASEDSTVILTLSKGDMVKTDGTEGSFTKISTSGDVNGYVLSSSLSYDVPETESTTIPVETPVDGEFIPDTDQFAGEPDQVEYIEENEIYASAGEEVPDADQEISGQ